MTIDDAFLPTGWYVCFHGRQLKDPMTWFGHVSLYGPTKDLTWVFLNPERGHFRVQVAHVYEEVNYLIGAHLERATEALYYEPGTITRRYPPIGIYNCAMSASHILGFRAWTPAGLRRTLLKSGAEIAYGRPGSGIEGVEEGA